VQQEVIISHNVTIGSTPLSDLRAVEKALVEINRENSTAFTLKEGPGTQIRGWNGARETVDAAILTGNKFKYDIGLMRQPNGTYLPRYEDLAGNDFARVVGAVPGCHNVDGKDAGVRSQVAYGTTKNTADFIGRLVQRTNVIMSENEAARHGMTSRRTVDDKTGLISLRVSNPRG